MASASEVLENLPNQLNGHKVSVRDVLDEMNGRSLLLTILILIVPNLIPFVNALGITQMTGILLLIFTMRMMIGIRRPWLPGWLLDMQTSKGHIQAMADKSVPYFKKLESIIRPRFRSLTTGKVQNFFFSFLLFALTIVMLLPMPFFNVVPAVVMTIITLGLLQRDGVTVFIGSIIAIVLLTGLGYGIATVGSEFLTTNMFDKDGSETFVRVFF